MMDTDHRTSDAMESIYWIHPAHLAPLRQNQSNEAVLPSHHAVPMVHYPTVAEDSSGIDSTSSDMRRHGLVTATTSGPPAELVPATAGAGGRRREIHACEPQHDEEDANSAGLSTLSPSTPPKPIRRRMRMITSCLECRRRKLKCAKTHPCLNCKRFQRECVYLGPNLDEASQQRLTEIKEKVGSLERQLERDVAKGATARRHGSSLSASDSHNQRFVADDVDDDLGEERDLQITPMVALDLTYDDYSDGNGTDDLIDLGVRVGKMRITERIGGLNRPRISEEVCIPLIKLAFEPLLLTLVRFKQV